MEYSGEDEFLKQYKVCQVLRRTSLCHIELLEHISDGSFLIRRTYFDDKREVFHALKGMKSPFLPQIRAVFFHADTIVYEEYIQGEMLWNYLENKELSPKESEHLLRELLEAVSAIHRAGIIHRDIKPENILVDERGHIHLLDFGISRRYRPNESRDTELMGTVGYAPVEQFGFSQSDFRTDIYAIGMTCRDINGICRTTALYRKIMNKSSLMDPMLRYQDITSMLAEFKKRRLFRFGMIFLMLIISFGIAFYVKWGIAVPASEKERNVMDKDHSQRDANVPYDDGKKKEGKVLFTGREHTPLMFLRENEKKESGAACRGLGEILLEAELTSRGLALHLSVSGVSSDFQLPDRNDLTESYEDTSLYAEILFYDLDYDGKEELWVAISDRAYYTLTNGEEGFNQNYMFGAGFYWDEDGRFFQMEPQMLSEGSLELDGTLPGGIWQGQEMEGYLLKDNELVSVE